MRVDAKNATAAIPATLDNHAMIVNTEQKLDQLVAFLESHRKSKIILFFLTCACVDFFYKLLSRLPQLSDIPVLSLHGRAPPAKRLGVVCSYAL